MNGDGYSQRIMSPFTLLISIVSSVLLAQARGSSSSEPPVEIPADVADVPAQDLKAGDNERMRYFLIGPREGGKPPVKGYKLLVIMPGGDGGANFSPFVRRIFKNALTRDFIVAQPVAFKWTPAQEVVWPTRLSPVAEQAFSTEQFVETVIEDVKRRHPIDARHVFTLTWSSSGPAAYAIASQEKTAVTGSYIAMSVYRPQWLPPAKVAAQRAYWLEHSPDDKVCPFRMAKQAETELAKAGATVKLTLYEGGHGWQGDVFGRIRRGIGWLVQRTSSLKSPATQTQPA